MFFNCIFCRGQEKEIFNNLYEDHFQPINRLQHLLGKKNNTKKYKNIFFLKERNSRR